MGLAKGISNSNAIDLLANQNIFVKDRFNSDSIECDTYLVSRGHPDGPLAILKLRLKRSRQTYGEQQHWNRVDHKHCLRLYESFPLENRIGCVTDYCVHGRLGSWVQRNKKNIRCDILQTMFKIWTKQLLQALAHLKELGLYHLNVCPDVLMLDQEMNLKLGGMSAIRTSRGRFLAFVDNAYQPLDVLFTQKRNTDFDKLHTWTAAAALLDAFTGLYIGGHSFKQCKPKVNEQKNNILENVKQIRSLPGLCDDLRDLFAIMLNHQLESRPKLEEMMATVYFWPNALTESHSAHAVYGKQMSSECEKPTIQNEMPKHHLPCHDAIAAPCMVPSPSNWFNDFWRSFYWTPRAESKVIEQSTMESTAQDLARVWSNFKRKLEVSRPENGKKRRKEGFCQFCAYCKPEVYQATAKETSTPMVLEQILNRNEEVGQKEVLNSPCFRQYSPCSSLENDAGGERYKNQSVQCIVKETLPMDIE